MLGEKVMCCGPVLDGLTERKDKANYDTTMTITTIKFKGPGVESTVTLQEDGRVTLVEGFYMVVTIIPGWESYHEQKLEGGTVYSSVSAWVTDMIHFLSTGFGVVSSEDVIIYTDSSAVSWIKSKKSYKEMRRGAKKKFSAGERKYWPTIEEWLAFLPKLDAVLAL